MRFTSTIAAAILAYATASTAAPLESRDTTPLQPWLLSGIAAQSSSGRPGSYPWTTITASLTDPNELDLGTSTVTGQPVTLPAGGAANNCQAKWLRGENPFGRSWPCDASGLGDGYWKMEILETSDFALTKFDAKFTRVAETLSMGSAYKKTYEATQHFEVATDGVMGGQCGSSGACGWGLKHDLAPLAIQQSEVA